jgi:hypothetical protein
VSDHVGEAEARLDPGAAGGEIVEVAAVMGLTGEAVQHARESGDTDLGLGASVAAPDFPASEGDIGIVFAVWVGHFVHLKA